MKLPDVAEFSLRSGRTVHACTAVAPLPLAARPAATGGPASRYDATVVDGDELSFTVIFVGENKKHEDEAVGAFCQSLGRFVGFNG